MENIKLVKITSPFLLVLIITIFLGFSPAQAQDTDLIRNGSFSSGLSEWIVNPETGSGWTPLTNGAINLHPPTSGYTGTVIYQNLNVTGIGGATLNFQTRLTTTSITPPAGNTIVFYLTFVDTANAVFRVKILSPDNNAIPMDPNDPGSVFTVSYMVPANTRKLVKIEVDKENYGPFVVDDISLITDAAVTIGALPSILSLSSSTGDYQSSLTITGTNFGAATPVVKISKSATGVTVTSASDTSIVITIQDPVQSGSVCVVSDFVESNINQLLDVTSPNYTMNVLQKKLVVVKGQIAEFVCRLDFLNGFTTQTGVNFTIQDLPAGTSATFVPVPVKNTGGVLLKIDTSTLAAGIYPFIIHASDGSTATRLATGSLEVVTISGIRFYRYNPPNQTTITEDVTQINLTTQGSFSSYGLTIDATDSQGNTWDLMENFTSGVSSPLTVSSSNPSVVLVQSDFWGPTYYARGAGNANIVVTATDGTQAALPVSVTIGAQTPQIDINVSPSTIHHNYTGDIIFSATSNYALTQVGTGSSGMITFSSTFSENGDWYNSNKSYGSTFKLNNQEPGIFTVNFTATTSDGTTSAGGIAPLQITADPAMGQIKGGVRLLDDAFAEMFTLGFYDPSDGTTPVFERELFMMHGAKNFHQVGIPPGTYKLRLSNPGDMVIPQWYGNADSFAAALPITITTGITDNIYFFNRAYPSISFSSSVKIGGNTYPAQAIEGAYVQVVEDSNIYEQTSGSGDFELSGIRADQNFELTITKNGFTPVYSAIFNSSKDIQTLLPYSLFPAGTLSTWGNTFGNGMILGRVSQLNDPTNYQDGAVVTAVNAADTSQTFPTTYMDLSGTFGGSATYENGVFAVLNVPADITVKLTVTKTGWGFDIPSSWVKVRSDSLCETSFFGTSVDEPAVRSIFESAMAAFANNNLPGFMAFVSADYLNSGETRTQFEAEISQMIQAGESMAYEIKSVDVQPGQAVMAILWNGVDSDTLYFKKEGANWMLYGNQQKYDIMAFSGHTQTSNWVEIIVEDPDSTITSVSVTGPGITGSINLNHSATQHSWVSWPTTAPYTSFGPEFGTSQPALPLTYTLTIVDSNQVSTTATATVNNFVNVFAVPSYPSSGQALSDLQSFSWTGVGSGFCYAIELNDANGARLSNIYDITGTSVAYTDQPLLPGSYSYFLQVRDQEENFSMVTVPFTIKPFKSDINADGNVTLADEIISLKLMAGINQNNLSLSADSNGDGKISIVESSHILQKAGMVRPGSNPVGIWNGTILNSSIGGSGTIVNWEFKQDLSMSGNWTFNPGNGVAVSLAVDGNYTYPNNRINFTTTGTATMTGTVTGTSAYTLTVKGRLSSGTQASGTYVIEFDAPGWADNNGNWSVTRTP
ncbi:MAG: hypothetical protein ABIJ31_06130 [Pseudomonadota bacterium]